MNKKTGIILIGILSLTTITLLLWQVFKEKDENETTTIFCGPNNTLPVIVFKNPSKAFPSFTTEYTSKVSGSISLMDSIKALGSFDLNSKVVELREKLNNESSRMEMLMRSNFFAFNSKPCDTTISRKYYDFLSDMAAKNSELETLKANLTTATSKGGSDSTQLTVIKDTAAIANALSKFIGNYNFQQ